MGKPTKDKKKPTPQIKIQEQITDKEPVVESAAPKFTFDTWFRISKKKIHWSNPMRTFADSKGIKEASIEEWNKLFESY